LIAGASLLATAGAASRRTPAAPRSPEEAAGPHRRPGSPAGDPGPAGRRPEGRHRRQPQGRPRRPGATTVSIAGGKPTIASGDGAFSANIHAVMQLDAAWYYQDKGLPAVLGNGRDLNSGTNFRRARLGVDGKLYKNFDYSVLLDFGGAGTDGAGTLQELWLQYNYAPFKVKVGAFAPNLGLEDAASTNGSLFAERPSGSELARGLAGADKRIAVQAQALGERWLVSGAITGAKAGDGQTFDEQLGYVGRVAFVPLKGYDWLVHVGANASKVAHPGPDHGRRRLCRHRQRPSRTARRRHAADHHRRDRRPGARHFGFELAAQKKNFLIQGEYFDIASTAATRAAGVTDPKFKAWYVEGSWVLTGEARKYNPSNFVFDAPADRQALRPEEGPVGRLGTGGALFRRRPELPRDRRPWPPTACVAASRRSPPSA
jgi:phosphate-selective porin OprO/OprP